jgi:hypothetical protein
MAFKTNKWQNVQKRHMSQKEESGRGSVRVTISPHPLLDIITTGTNHVCAANPAEAAGICQYKLPGNSNYRQCLSQKSFGKRPFPRRNNVRHSIGANACSA